MVLQRFNFSMQPVDLSVFVHGERRHLSLERLDLLALLLHATNGLVASAVVQLSAQRV